MLSIHISHFTGTVKVFKSYELIMASLYVIPSFTLHPTGSGFTL
jgi:hypothetical protein